MVTAFWSQSAGSTGIGSGHRATPRALVVAPRAAKVVAGSTKNVQPPPSGTLPDPAARKTSVGAVDRAWASSSWNARLPTDGLPNPDNSGAKPIPEQLVP